MPNKPSLAQIDKKITKHIIGHNHLYRKPTEIRKVERHFECESYNKMFAKKQIGKFAWTSNNHVPRPKRGGYFIGSVV